MAEAAGCNEWSGGALLDQENTYLRGAGFAKNACLIRAASDSQRPRRKKRGAAGWLRE